MSNSPILTILAGILIAAIGAIGTLLAAKRKTSGTINTSEPQILWANLLTELTASRQEIHLLKTELKTTYESMTSLKEETYELKDSILILKETMAELRQELVNRLGTVKDG